MGDQRTFYQLCYDGDIEAVQAAIDNGADVNEENDLGETGLMWASYRNHNNVVQLLLQHPQMNFFKLLFNIGDSCFIILVSALMATLSWQSLSSKRGRGGLHRFHCNSDLPLMLVSLIVCLIV